jgi:hypothetical protein
VDLARASWARLAGDDDFTVLRRERGTSFEVPTA